MASEDGFDGFESEDDRFLFAEAQLGIEMEAFLRSNVGYYLLERLRGEVNGFTSWVLDQPSPDSEQFKIRHNEAKAAQKAMRFISEALVNGKSAEKSLSERDDQDTFGDGPL